MRSMPRFLEIFLFMCGWQVLFLVSDFAAGFCRPAAYLLNSRWFGSCHFSRVSRTPRVESSKTLENEPFAAYSTYFSGNTAFSCKSAANPRNTQFPLRTRIPPSILPSLDIHFTWVRRCFQGLQRTRWVLYGHVCSMARMTVSGAVPLMYAANGVYGLWGLHPQPKWEKGVHNQLHLTAWTWDDRHARRPRGDTIPEV